MVGTSFLRQSGRYVPPFDVPAAMCWADRAVSQGLRAAHGLEGLLEMGQHVLPLLRDGLRLVAMHEAMRALDMEGQGKAHGLHRQLVGIGGDDEPPGDERQ
jgi:hypothetical protein